jgi:hypothetical protein
MTWRAVSIIPCRGRRFLQLGIQLEAVADILSVHVVAAQVEIESKT